MHFIPRYPSDGYSKFSKTDSDTSKFESRDVLVFVSTMCQICSCSREAPETFNFQAVFSHINQKLDRETRIDLGFPLLR